MKCKKYTKNINPRVSGTSNGKESRFINTQEVKGLLSNLGLRTPLSKVPVLSDILFWIYKKWMK